MEETDPVRAAPRLQCAERVWHGKSRSQSNLLEVEPAYGCGQQGEQCSAPRHAGRHLWRLGDAWQKSKLYPCQGIFHMPPKKKSDFGPFCLASQNAPWLRLLFAVQQILHCGRFRNGVLCNRNKKIGEENRRCAGIARRIAAKDIQHEEGHTVIQPMLKHQDIALLLSVGVFSSDPTGLLIHHFDAVLVHPASGPSFWGGGFGQRWWCQHLHRFAKGRASSTDA